MKARRLTKTLSSVCLVAAVLTGCSTPNGPFGQRPDGLPTGAPLFAEQCLRERVALDDLIRQRGASVSEAHAVTGFPYLRSSRLLASYRQDLPLTNMQQAWLGRLSALELNGRAAEIANVGLPEVSRILGHDKALSYSMVMAQLQRCNDALIAYDLRSPERLKRIRDKSRVPDVHSSIRRIFGLYALNWPWLARTEQRALQTFRGNLSESRTLPQTSHSIGPVQKRRGQDVTSRLLDSRRRDAMGLPVLTREVERWLLSEFAPILTFTRDGKPGRMLLKQTSAGVKASVDPTIPTLYGRVSSTRYDGHSLVQLVYQVWFADSERPKSAPPGPDGMVFRITLNRRGVPVIYDLIRSRGYYHHFVMTEQVTLRQGASNDRRVNTLVAAPENSRIRLVIDSARRQVLNIDYVSDDAQLQRHYRLQKAQRLNTLPIDGDHNKRQSVFNTSNIIAGSAQGERFTRWASGIPDAGSARQWGHHASSTTARQHFDDAHAIERLFSLD